MILRNQVKVGKRKNRHQRQKIPSADFKNGGFLNCRKLGLTAHTPLGYTDFDMKTALKNKLIRRLKIIEGQVRGLQEMVKKEQYCVEIITQASAVKKALSSFENLMLKNHLSTHVIEQIRSGRNSQAVQEVLKVYKLSKKD